MCKSKQKTKNEINSQKIIPSFKESLLNDSIKGLGVDLLEIGIDSFLDIEIIKEIPMIKTVLSLGKTVVNIKDRNLMKNTLIFIKELNSGKIDSKSYEKYKKKMENPRIAEKELGRVLIILDRFIDNIKVVFLSRLFKSYVEEDISWIEFCDFSEIIDRFLVSDFNSFLEAFNRQKIYEKDVYLINDSHKRFENYGLMSNKNYFGSVWIDDDSGSELIAMTEKGNKMAKVIFNSSHNA